jgi:hypothetical protein
MNEAYSLFSTETAHDQSRIDGTHGNRPLTGTTTGAGLGTSTGATIIYSMRILSYV